MSCFGCVSRFTTNCLFHLLRTCSGARGTTCENAKTRKASFGIEGTCTTFVSDGNKDIKAANKLEEDVVKHAELFKSKHQSNKWMPADKLTDAEKELEEMKVLFEIRIFAFDIHSAHVTLP